MRPAAIALALLIAAVLLLVALVLRYRLIGARRLELLSIRVERTTRG